MQVNLYRREDRQTDEKRKSSNQKHTEINTSTDKQNKKLQITITSETNAFNSLIMFGVSPSNYANNNSHSFLALPRERGRPTTPPDTCETVAIKNHCQCVLD